MWDSSLLFCLIIYPVRPPYVRMLAEDYTVKWIPQDNNTKTKLESEGFIHPGGIVTS